jgi:hypothetical protein
MLEEDEKFYATFPDARKTSTGGDIDLKSHMVNILKAPASKFT